MNLRPLGPEPSALAKLSYSPFDQLLELACLVARLGPEDRPGLAPAGLPASGESHNQAPGAAPKWLAIAYAGQRRNGSPYACRSPFAVP